MSDQDNTVITAILGFLSGPVLGGFGVGVWKLGRMWIDARRTTRLAEIEASMRANKAEAELAAREDEHEERTETKLWDIVKDYGDRIVTLERDKQACQDTLIEAHEILGEVKLELNECKRDRAEGHRIAAAQADRISKLEAVVPVDITQKIRTEAGKAVRKAMSDSHGLPAVREEIAVRKPGSDEDK